MEKVAFLNKNFKKSIFFVFVFDLHYLYTIRMSVLAIRAESREGKTF